jgi:DNA-directed RNA polymerase subunit RPC12/RpoP
MNRGPFDSIPARGRQPGGGEAQFDQFEATELYCPKCGRAVPVRKFLLLILPDGDKYEYRCQFCGSKVGDKMDRTGQYFGILKA